MVLAYIALGANLGDAASAIRQAVSDLRALPQTQFCACSSLYRTAPVYGAAEKNAAAGEKTAPVGDYLNAVVAIETALTAPALLRYLQQLEHRAGRQRSYHEAPRTLDLDLLLYGSASIASRLLTLPHPRMWQRAFVLVPLAEIAPGVVDAAQLSAVSDQKVERVGVIGVPH